MKSPIIKTILVLAATISFFFSEAQLKDSASYKHAVIQYYKQQTMGIPGYKYIPNGYTQYQQDTMFVNALAFKKENLDYPLFLNLYKLKKGSPEAKAKIKYFEDTASSKEYEEMLTKARKLYAAENKKTPAKYVTKVRKPTGGKMKNNDKEIAEDVLKKMKF